MSGIQGVGNNQPVGPIINQSVLRQVQSRGTAGSSADRLELSGVGHLLQQLKNDGAVRADKVADVKARIEAGTYEDDQKLDTAIDRLLDELNS